MSYVALYRKYRSQSFHELMGQAHVTQTLQNAIKSGRIAHAYLFHGARGCGKTSTARLLARALNCEQGPTPEPCGVCRLCTAIRDGACLDVIEIDAASQTGIDNVREVIIENVQYAPAEGRYKVYIIDEVHDLSAKAFDALLKTLEEPPAHVVFILATTEKHKVPITIRSRCQDYQFKRGTLQDLAAAVQRVITEENYAAEPEAVLAIARAAEGSWRDSLSLLEQVMAYSDGAITMATVQRAIGTVGSDLLSRVVEALATDRWDETYAIAAELVESGTDVRQLLTSLQAYLRELLLIAAGAHGIAKAELGADRYALLQPQAAYFDPATLLAMHGVLAETERELRFSNQHRLLLERALLRMMPSNLTRAAQPAPAPMREAAAPPQRAASVQTAPPLAAATPTVVPKPPTPQLVEFAPTATEAEEEPDEEESAAPIPAQPISAPPPLKIVESTPPERTAAPMVEAAPAASADRFAQEVTLQVVQRAWSRILKEFEKVSKNGFAFLTKSEPVGLEGLTIVLAFSSSYARDRIQDKGRDAVERTINRSLGTEGYKIRCILQEERVSAVKSAPPPPAEPLALLDAPQATAPSGPTRFMDIELTDAPSAPTATYAPPTPASPPEQVKEAPAPEPAEAQPRFLETVLELFPGSEVVQSEPK